MQFNPKKLSQDRIIIALTDIIMQIMSNNRHYMQQYIDKIGLMGTEIVQPQKLKRQLIMLSHSLGFSINASTIEMLEQVPENINYKQLIFFAYLDQQLAPKIVKIIMHEEQRLLRQGKLLDLISLREQIYPLIASELKDFMQKIKNFQ